MATNIRLFSARVIGVLRPNQVEVQLLETTCTMEAELFPFELRQPNAEIWIVVETFGLSAAPKEKIIPRNGDEVPDEYKEYRQYPRTIA